MNITINIYGDLYADVFGAPCTKEQAAAPLTIKVDSFPDSVPAEWDSSLVHAAVCAILETIFDEEKSYE